MGGNFREKTIVGHLKAVQFHSLQAHQWSTYYFLSTEMSHFGLLSRWSQNFWFYLLCKVFYQLKRSRLDYYQAGCIFFISQFWLIVCIVRFVNFVTLESVGGGGESPKEFGLKTPTPKLTSAHRCSQVYFSEWDQKLSEIENKENRSKNRKRNKEKHVQRKVIEWKKWRIVVKMLRTWDEKIN